jgi:hypothetical protein
LIEENTNGKRPVITDMSKEKIRFLFLNIKALLTPKLVKTSELEQTLWIMHFEQGIVSFLFLNLFKRIFQQHRLYSLKWKADCEQLIENNLEGNGNDLF